MAAVLDPEWQTPAMEPGVVLAIVIVCVVLLAARQGAARRAANGDPRVGWVVAVPLLLGSLVVAWTGATVAAYNLPAGLAILAVAAVTILLLARAMRGVIQASIVNGQSGDMPEPWLDYLVWTMIGAPLVLAALLVVMAVANRLSGR